MRRQLRHSGSERRTVGLRGRQSGIGEGSGGVEHRRQLPHWSHQGLLQGRRARSARGDARGETIQHLLQLPGAHPRLPDPQELHQALRSKVSISYEIRSVCPSYARDLSQLLVCRLVRDIVT